MPRPRPSEEVVQRSVRLPSILSARLAAVIAERGVTLNSAIVEAIRHWVDGEVVMPPQQPSALSTVPVPDMAYKGIGRDPAAFLASLGAKPLFEPKQAPVARPWMPELKRVQLLMEREPDTGWDEWAYLVREANLTGDAAKWTPLTNPKANVHRADKLDLEHPLPPVT